MSATVMAAVMLAGDEEEGAHLEAGFALAALTTRSGRWALGASLFC